MLLFQSQATADNKTKAGANQAVAVNARKAEECIKKADGLLWTDFKAALREYKNAVSYDPSRGADVGRKMMDAYIEHSGKCVFFKYTIGDLKNAANLASKYAPGKVKKIQEMLVNSYTDHAYRNSDDRIADLAEAVKYPPGKTTENYNWLVDAYIGSSTYRANFWDAASDLEDASKFAAAHLPGRVKEINGKLIDLYLKHADDKIETFERIVSDLGNAAKIAEKYVPERKAEIRNRTADSYEKHGDECITLKYKIASFEQAAKYDPERKEKIDRKIDLAKFEEKP